MKQMSNKRSNEHKRAQCLYPCTKRDQLTSRSTNGFMNNEGVLEVCGGREIKLTL